MYNVKGYNINQYPLLCAGVIGCSGRGHTNFEIDPSSVSSSVRTDEGFEERRRYFHDLLRKK